MNITNVIRCRDAISLYFVRKFAVQLGMTYTGFGGLCAAAGGVKAHQEYMSLMKKSEYPMALNAVMYPMSVMGGMTAGVGIATYTPIFLGICTWYWRDFYKEFIGEYNRLTLSNVPQSNKEIVVVNGGESLR